DRADQREPRPHQPAADPDARRRPAALVRDRRRAAPAAVGEGEGPYPAGRSRDHRADRDPRGQQRRGSLLLVKVLGIDSASGIASAAVLDGDVVLAETRSETAGHRADLLVLVDTVCTGAAITARDLDAVAIGAGPGSFTGLRIGMATAKGIAFA